MKNITLLLCLILAFPYAAWGSDEHGHDEHDVHEKQQNKDEHGHDEEGVRHAEIDADIAQRIGINTAEVTSGTIEKTIRAFAKVSVAPNNTANISARFPGVVTELYVTLGDTVAKGANVAKVESNDSLQPYTIKAPIVGVIQAQYVNIGQTTDDKSLMLIVNHDVLWAEINIFPMDRSKVHVGQSATLHGNHQTFKGKISHLLPSTDAHAVTHARVKIDNQQGQFVPGDMLSVNIAVDEIPVPLLVVNEAIQQIDNQQVVFIKQGERYELRPITLGHSDDRYTQVISGLALGEQYVAENSYLIKADIEKSAAAHHH
ncbi:efflux RND transporter periplasmic adaptor subunit [Shewanella livingstonensis]|uniref:HlyD family efflux transporter periplasmic adaptor subunit n=1 Tax=Shewanella livingstonensis TaxID=150120 RepID=A0A3G8LUI4_9GAMM|nr:efflux RND transporter periplasmic adaptor subunit [Shewanella livingstonensis]AZG73251.1 HlyD family efflux transporter periplasmic adaptor subunit [Shewanella livingstonensis]